MTREDGPFIVAAVVLALLLARSFARRPTDEYAAEHPSFRCAPFFRERR
jgi:hypothetical protein